jgi:hypothetical protein
MITLIVVTAFLAPSILIVSACMLSSRVSQAEEVPVACYETNQAAVGLTSVHSHS